MLRRVVRKLNRLTPYSVIRRDSEEHDAAYDAIAHNTEAEWDIKFSNADVLRGYVTKARHELYQLIVEYTSKASPITDKVGTIADIGCGPGDLLRMLAEAYPGWNTIGYDFSRATVDQAARRFPGGTFRQHNIYDAPAMSAEIVLCTETLEHLVEPEVALRRLIEWVKPGGCLILTVPDGRRDNFKGHINFWSRESWRRFVSMNSSGLSYQVDEMHPSSAKVGNLAAILKR